MKTPETQILVVDDDQSLLTALKSALCLRMQNIDVVTVDSGDEALRLLETSDFDVVITDIKMPGMDGLALLNEIRNRDPQLPTLLITGHGQHDLAVQALRGGAFDFIQKPLDRDYLVAALNRAIQVRQLHKTVISQQTRLECHAAELEDRVRDRTRELRELNHAKDRFLAMLAHELRNPLACIRHSLDLLDSPREEPEKPSELFALMSRQVTHMTHLLDDLLDVSRISRNEITLRKAPVDLSSILQNSIDAVQPVISELRHDLQLDLPTEHITIDGDHSRLEQIFVNLLHNAAKYTDPFGTIRVSAEFEEGEAVIHVQDNGIGISPEMLEQVFELFSQADHSLDRARGGLGIGLTLVQKLTQLHGGTVSPHSDGEGCGCTFTVRLPARRSSDPPESAAAVAPPEMDRHRIVLVEDNITLAKLTSKLLENCGQEVVAVVSDGLSAIQVTCDYRPDFVFLDIGIPKLDGYEVARRLRELDHRENLTIVALTGYGREEDRARSLQAGFDFHLTKPVSIDALSTLFVQAAGDRRTQAVIG